mmetsp:Transcript_37821/g.83081  ORF Transcript_37821/g.83081 Transcript_37821/m.83081 type:complete len:458 (+) Transcript_37821:150-1523(+)
MAGTRLFVHSAFLIEIVFLVGLSVYYGALPPSPLELGSIIRSDADPLFIDRSGLSVLTQSSAGGASIGDRIDELDRLGQDSFPSSTALSHDALERLITNSPACTVMLTAVDEDPASHVPVAAVTRTKQHHDMIGAALGAIADETVRPMLNQLSDVTQFTVRTRTVAFGQLSSTAETVQVRDRDNGNDNGNSTNTHYVIGMKDARRFWSQHGSVISSPRRFAPSSIENNGCYVDLIIYVPSKKRTPLSIHGGKNRAGDTITAEAFAMQGGRGSVAIANLASNDDISCEEVYSTSLLNAASYLTEYLRTVTGLSAVKEVSSLRRELLQPKYTMALTKIRSAWDVAENTSGMTVTATMGDRIANCLGNLQHAVEAVKAGDSALCMSDMNTVLLAVDALTSDREMLEKTYFPRDHYLAVFTPLVLPLLLPLLLGLAREMKRYKSLSNGESDDAQTEKNGSN